MFVNKDLVKKVYEMSIPNYTNFLKTKNLESLCSLYFTLMQSLSEIENIINLLLKTYSILRNDTYKKTIVEVCNIATNISNKVLLLQKYICNLNKSDTI